MRLDLFWRYKSMLDAEGLEVGFGMFSPAHFIWLFLMTAGIAAFTLFYLRGDERKRDDMRKTMALFIILFEIFKQCAMALTGAPIERNLPLHVCSFAEYAMLADAMWPDERFLRQAFLYLFLPAAVMAITFPTVTAYPAVNFYTIHLFVLHSGIAAYIIARYARGEFVPTYRGIWTSLAQLLPIGFMIYLIDFGFDKNYMFLSNPSGNAMLTGAVEHLRRQRRHSVFRFAHTVQHRHTARLLWDIPAYRRNLIPACEKGGGLKSGPRRAIAGAAVMWRKNTYTAARRWMAGGEKSLPLDEPAPFQQFSCSIFVFRRTADVSGKRKRCAEHTA